LWICGCWYFQICLVCGGCIFGFWDFGSVQCFCILGFGDFGCWDLRILGLLVIVCICSNCMFQFIPEGQLAEHI
jgi:hypothetical protein